MTSKDVNGTELKGFFDIAFENKIESHTNDVIIMTLSQTEKGKIDITKPSALLQPLFRDSVCCRKLTKVMNRENILKVLSKSSCFAVDELNDLNYVIQFKFENVDSFVESIDDMEDFYQFLRIADKYSLQPHIIEDEILNSYWIFKLISESHHLWEKNMGMWESNVDRAFLESDVFQRIGVNNLKTTDIESEAVYNRHEDYPRWETHKVAHNMNLKFPDCVKNVSAKDLPFTKEVVLDILQMCETHNLKKISKTLANILVSSLQWCDEALQIKALWKNSDSKFLNLGLRYKYFQELFLFSQDFNDMKDKGKTGEISQRCLIPLDAIHVKRNISCIHYPTLARRETHKRFWVSRNHMDNKIEGKPIFSTQRFEDEFIKLSGGMFQNIDWKDIAIVGSTLPRCIFSWENGSESHFSNSDIDVMVCADSLISFDYRVQKLYEQISKNIDKRVVLEKHSTQNKHKFSIIVVEGDAQEESDDPFSTFEHARDKSYPRIDIFLVNNIPYMVSRFHFSVVRMFFDGKTVWVLPTGVHTICTGEITDIRWVSCNSSLKDTITKYLNRGFKFKLNQDNYNEFVTTLNTDTRTTLYTERISPSPYFHQTFVKTMWLEWLL